jgi:cytochrome b involved in lipid metabolism
MDKIITWTELENHITFDDCWIIIEGFVYDVSDFVVEHPGGDDILVK